MTIGRRVALVIIATLTCAARPLGQTVTERFWIAARYDQTQWLVYFSAGAFGNVASLPVGATKVPPPIIKLYPFPPIALTQAGLKQFRAKPGSTPFAVGDTFTLMLDDGRNAPITLTRLVGFQNDEEVGNESFIGALGRVADTNRDGLRKDYYIVSDRNTSSVPPPSPARAARAGLSLARVPTSVTSQAGAVIRAHVQADTRSRLRARAAGRGPAIQRAQQFTLANGSVRYYMFGNFGEGADGDVCRFGAIVAAAPLRVLSVDESACLNANGEAVLLNVLDLGGGRTGVIVDRFLGDGRALELVRYDETLSLFRMPTLQSLSSAE
jgi:hypothetical protein